MLNTVFADVICGVFNRKCSGTHRGSTQSTLTYKVLLLIFRMKMKIALHINCPTALKCIESSARKNPTQFKTDTMYTVHTPREIGRVGDTMAQDFLYAIHAPKNHLETKRNGARARWKAKHAFAYGTPMMECDVYSQCFLCRGGKWNFFS